MKRTFFPVLFRGLSKIINGSYKNSNNRIGETIQLEWKGRKYEVFKQSDIEGLSTEGRVYFNVEFSFKKWVPNYFSPTIPFFIGMPGFISKLWLVDKNNGDYAGQYVFASRKDAEGYGHSFAQRLVKKLCVPGKYKWSVTEIKRIRTVKNLPTKPVRGKIMNVYLNGILFV